MQPTLSSAFSDLLAITGHFGGYGRGADAGDRAWTTQQEADITQAVTSGLEMFYHCGYDWSFLHVVTTLTLASGSNVIPLPDDCGGVEGRIAVSVASGSSIICHLSVGNIGMVLENEARFASQTGHPQLCAVEALKGTSHQKGQDQRLHVYPTADQAYTFKFQYYVNPDYPSAQYPYAYGGPQHSQTLKAACKAAFERDIDDLAQGPQQMAFKEALQASIDMDRRMKPQHLGYNADRSDDLHGGGNRLYRMDQTITFAGVNPGD